MLKKSIFCLVCCLFFFVHIANAQVRLPTRTGSKLDSLSQLAIKQNPTLIKFNILSFFVFSPNIFIETTINKKTSFQLGIHYVGVYLLPDFGFARGLLITPEIKNYLAARRYQSPVLKGLYISAFGRIGFFNTTITEGSSLLGTRTTKDVTINSFGLGSAFGYTKVSKSLALDLWFGLSFNIFSNVKSIFIEPRLGVALGFASRAKSAKAYYKTQGK